MVPPVQALLFDMDGTLVDSMPLHHAAWREWHRRHALPFDEDGFFAATAGRTNAEILRDLFPALDEPMRAAMAEEKERLYREAAVHSLQWIAGAPAIIEAARRRGLKLAVCTASPIENIAVAIRRLGLDALVDTIVSPADDLPGKPAPDIFLTAARRLVVPPGACLVFEDAPLGVEAARRAGMAAVALTTTLPAEAFGHFDNLRAAHPDFLDLDLERLVASPAPHSPEKESRHA
jgi:HAD superfamily hydrolase (TIGR01509 family)